MKHFYSISILAILCLLAACSGSTVTDLDKNFHNASQAVEELYNNPPTNLNLLKESVKFKENDKLSDYQKDEFFKQIQNKKLKVTAQKAKVKPDFTEVTCEMTLSNGSTKKKKFHLYKENNVWKTEIGFTELKEVIYK